MWTALKEFIEEKQLITIADSFRKQQIFEKLLFFMHFSKKRQVHYERYIQLRARSRSMVMCKAVFARLKTLMKASRDEKNKDAKV